MSRCLQARTVLSPYKSTLILAIADIQATHIR
jgi:hypothetical protein